MDDPAIRIRTDMPDLIDVAIERYDWSKTAYAGYADSNLCHNILDGKVVTWTLHLSIRLHSIGTLKNRQPQRPPHMEQKGSDTQALIMCTYPTRLVPPTFSANIGAIGTFGICSGPSFSGIVTWELIEQ